MRSWHSFQTKVYWLHFLLVSVRQIARTDNLSLLPSEHATFDPSKNTASHYLHQKQNVITLLLLQQTISSKSVLSLKISFLGDNVEAQSLVAFHPCYMVRGWLITRISWWPLWSGVGIGHKHLPQPINFRHWYRHCTVFYFWQNDSKTPRVLYSSLDKVIKKNLQHFSLVFLVSSDTFLLLVGSEQFCSFTTFVRNK